MAAVFRSLWLGAALCLLNAAVASATPPNKPPNDREPVGECNAPTALGRLACRLTSTVPKASGMTVVSAPLAGAPAGSDVRGLAAVLSRLMAANIEGRDGGVARGLPDALLRSKTPRLLWLQPSIQQGQLSVSLDIYATERSFWERVKQQVPATLHHAYEKATVDAEIRSYLPIVKLVGSLLLDAKSPVTRTSGLACGDFDGDGGLELAVADRHRILIGRFPSGGKFAAEHPFRWSDSSAVAPVPLREPIVTLEFTKPGVFRFASTDRRYLGEYTRERGVVGTQDSLLLWSPFGCVRRSGMGLDTEVVDCVSGVTGKTKPPVAQPVDTVAGDFLTLPDGSTRVVAAARQVGEDILRVFDNLGHETTITEAGAQAAIGDLDLDGYAEIAASRNTLDRGEDSLRVFTWRPPDLLPRFEVPVPGGVDAVTFCPVESMSQNLTVIASGSRLWILG